MKTINSFRNEYFFLSNMYPCKVYKFSCAEAAFQACKCANPEDRERFIGLDGKSAKALGRKVELVEGWNDIRVKKMYSVVLWKFRENPSLTEKLIATGDATLIEGNTWGDTFWGACNGAGKNMLGKILMKVREDLGGSPSNYNNSEKETENMNATEKKEIGYEEVKKMAFYFFETMSRLANHSFTEEQLAARKAKGQAITLMQAINEVITPDDVMGVDPITKEEIVVGHKPNKYNGSYKCYSQRCFDQGNAGDPYEYTGVQFTFRLANGISITIDTKYANIRAQFYSNKYEIGIGRKLCEGLDDLGAALWQDWDDAPDNLVRKMRQVEDEDAWWDDDYMYTERKTWSRPTEDRNYSKLESDFERDCKGGVRYTQREWDGHTGLYFNGEVRRFYQAVLAEQERARRECREADARREQYKVRAPGKMITWENMSEAEKAAAIELYRSKKASE